MHATSAAMADKRYMESSLSVAGFLLSALLVFSIFNGASSQTSRQVPATGRIEGETKDFIGISVPRAIVKFESDTVTREVVSDESGKFLIDLPVTVYKVTVQRFGIYDPYQRKNVRVRSGKTKKLEIELTFDLKKYPPVI
ncbi:MAG TPA: carboxypeptidase-like regulatory domain-containing protein [Pyrinomonadaceae bacterium]|nr:carboxypeptidase-like regulatory domain-containing protein [Pyrinomonadaceae bacterium]